MWRPKTLSECDEALSTLAGVREKYITEHENELAFRTRDAINMLLDYRLEFVAV